MDADVAAGQERLVALLLEPATNDRDQAPALLAEVLTSLAFAESVLRLADGQPLRADGALTSALSGVVRRLSLAESALAAPQVADSPRLLADLLRGPELGAVMEGRVSSAWMSQVADVLEGARSTEAPPGRTAIEAGRDAGSVYGVFHAREPEPQVLATAPLKHGIADQCVTAIASAEFAARFAHPILANQVLTPAELPARERIGRVAAGLGLAEGVQALALEARTWPVLLFVLLASTEVRARLKGLELGWSLDQFLAAAQLPIQQTTIPAATGREVTRSDVVNGYRFFLGREPESETGVASKLGHSSQALVLDFLTSGEFAAADFAGLINRRRPVAPELRSWAVSFFKLEAQTRLRLRFTEDAPSILAASLADGAFRAMFDTSALGRLYSALAVALGVEGPVAEAGPTAILQPDAVLAWGGFDALYYAGARDLDGLDVAALVEDYIERGEALGIGPNALFYPHWYRRRHRLGLGVSPLAHYLEHGERLAADPCPAFDTGFYRRVNVAELAAGEPLAHYVNEGWGAGLDPNPAFDTTWYRAHHFEPERARDPLSHYLAYGADAGAEPHPLFDSRFYVRGLAPGELFTTPLEHYLSGECESRSSPSAIFQCAWYRDVYRDLLGPDVDALWHYHRLGTAARTNPNPCFDGSWYRAAYPNACAAGLSPAAHYMRIGAGEGGKPHPLFDAPWYARTHVGAIEGDMEGLTHYLTFGWREGLDPNPLFDTDWYQLRYPDAGWTGVDPLGHYITVGWRQGRAPNAFFDPAWYLRTYPEVAAAGLDPLRHYLEQGWSKGHDPSPCFSTRWYLDRHPEILADGWNPLAHYIQVGRPQGWPPRPGGGDALLHRTDPCSTYERWRQENEPSYAVLMEAHKRALASWPSPPPLISILTPTYNTPLNLLDSMVESVLRQTYPHWEMCVVDDASTDPGVAARLRQHEGAEPRIRLAVSPVNQHVSLASNAALAMARGEWVVLLDHDDMLSPDALYEIANAIRLNPDARVVYSDQDKIDLEGRRTDPFFKPGISPEQLLAQNYVNHVCGFSTALVRRLGGWRAGFEGSQDHDLILRALAEAGADAFVHIPKVLYHWRAAPGSTAASVGAKPYALAAGRIAVAEHLAQTGRRGDVEIRDEYYNVSLNLPEPPPAVGLLIVVRDQADRLKSCVDSIRTLTDYPDYRLLVLDNGSREPSTFAVFDALAEDPRVTILPLPGPTYSPAMNNFGIERLDTEVVGLLSADVEVISPMWMRDLAAWAVQPEIGCVGPKLYYSDDTLEQAGLVLGVGGVAGYSHKHLRRGQSGYFGRMNVHHNVSAVSSACLFVERRKFLEVGGLDEALTTVFHDVDLCLRVRGAGYRNLLVPTAELRHHASGFADPSYDAEVGARSEQDYRAMRLRWADLLDDDVYYSPNLSREPEAYSIRLKGKAL